MAAGLLLTGSGLMAAGAVAGAQDSTTTIYPGTSVAPPTTAPATTTTAPDGNGDIDSSAPLGPNAVVDLTVNDDDLDNKTVGGTLQSTTVTLPVTTAANDSVTFKSVKLPADFNRNANHTITVVDQATGQVVAKQVFGVNGSGQIVAAYSTSNLPKTGTDYVDPAVKVGGALLAAGAVALLVARRRKDAAQPAA